MTDPQDRRAALDAGRRAIAARRRAVARARVEDIELLVASGCGSAAVASRVGLTVGGLYRALHRAGRLDLWRAARRAEGASGVRGDQRAPC